MSQKSKRIFCTINDQPITLVQKSCFQELSPLDWLKTQSNYPLFYYKTKDTQLEIGASGVLIHSKKPPEIRGPKSIFFCGGGSRHGNKYPWEGIAEGFYFLPQNAVIKEKGKTLFLENALLTPFLFNEQQVSSFSESPSLKINDHSFEDAVRLALLEIAKGSFSKVVLAKIHSEDKKETDPLKVLMELQEKNPQAFIFFIAFDEKTSFFGASPERLLYRKKNTVFSEAIAGTKKLASLEKEKALLENDLLNNPKESEEFSYVKNEISKLFSPLSKTLKWYKKDRILKASNLLHRYNRIEVTLKADISNEKLITLLHPTPAIGGFPKEEALNFIAKHENFERGWYAAPFGIIRRSSLDLCVAIRSSLIKNEKIHFFAGAGIVIGSDPLKEKEEISAKIETLKGIYDCV